MNTIPVSSECWLEFKPMGRTCRATTQSATRIPERLKTTRQRDHRWKPLGDLPKDHVVARAWRSVFQHEVPFASPWLPLTDDLPNASDAVHTRILIADDDSVVRGSLAAVLESEGFVVDEARNGIEAVNHAIAHLPGLVLLDLNMPHWDGWTAFSQLDRVTPLLPVIVITARPNQYEKAVQLGVDAFMEKPLSIPMLVRAIKRLTNEDEIRHVRRIPNHRFVTQFLDNKD